jgi:phosphoglycerol transferase MdoB-like AlkP superfamily enzyme
LLDLTLFRHAPHHLKIKVYNDERWFLQDEGLSSLTPNHQGSIRFVDAFEKRIDGDATVPTFKLLHLLVPHGPYHLTPECARYIGPSISATRKFTNNAECALKLVDIILKRLREFGAYDSNTIVLVADHGTPIGFDPKGFGTPLHKNLRRAVPLLLIKPAGYRAAEGEELKIDNQPISQLEILELINQKAQLGLTIPPSKARTADGSRLFYNYAWAHDNWSSDVLPKSKTWIINGDSWNMDNWRGETP